MVYKFPVSKNFTLKRAMSRFSVEIFLSRGTENFRRGTLQCVNNFSHQKMSCVTAEYRDFCKKNCCLLVSQNFVEEPFFVSENFWYRKLFGIREGAGVTFFRQNCFVSPETFLRGTILYCVL